MAYQGRDVDPGSKEEEGRKNMVVNGLLYCPYRYTVLYTVEILYTTQIIALY